MAAVIESTHLHKSYGSVRAVDGVSLAVERGEVFGVIGPNGAGKSTTVETAAGLRRPDSGTVRVLGLDPAKDPDAVRQRVGVQLQQAVLPSRMKVKEAMAVFTAAYRDHADPEALLADWGLAEHRNAGFCEALRRAEAAAVHRPGVAREARNCHARRTHHRPRSRRPSGHLGNGSALKERGVTVVLVTHAMDEAEILCDRLVVINSGRIIAEGSPDEVRAEHRTLEAAYLELTAPGLRRTR